MRKLFQRVLADRKRIALASSAIGEELETYKRVAEISDLIDAETSADDAEQSKPYPHIFSGCACAPQRPFQRRNASHRRYAL